MNDTYGGDSERVAPIIPLFGKQAPDQAAPADPVALRRTSEGGLKQSSREGAVVPMPLGDTRDAGAPSDRHPARGAAAKATTPERPPAPKLRALRNPQSDGEIGGAEPERSPAEIRATAEEGLLRKLRNKSLSISEARLVLRGHGLDAGGIDDVIEDFCRRQYLDDAVLAGLLVTSGVERKGQGRVALSRALSQRGLSRDVIDAALDELPDDDAERALEFARSKARSMGRLDNDTALRRLVGQLSRRGYNGAVAMNAAKTALKEVSSGGSSSGVRFVDSD